MFTDQELNEFREKENRKFDYSPSNERIRDFIALMPLWQLEIFKWQERERIKGIIKELCVSDEDRIFGNGKMFIKELLEMIDNDRTKRIN